MKTILSISSLIIATALSSTAISAEVADGKVKSCRAFLNGSINIILDKKASCGSEFVKFSSNINTSVRDRVLALCMSSSTSGRNLRIDYITCNGKQANTTDSTSVQIKN